MKYVLLLLFFTTPPAQHVDAPTRKAKSVWTFKSSTSLEFDTRPACETNGQIVIDGLDDVDTMTATGWCFCKAEPGTVCADDKKALTSSNQFKGFSTMKVQPRASEEAVEPEVHQLVSKSLNAIAKQNLAKKPR
jgi:hypothetical protein